MPLREDAKRMIERVTGWGRPASDDLSLLMQSRKPHLLRFKKDGETPNNARFPMVLYRSPVKLRHDFDAAAVFEDLFEANGWKDSWRDGMYDFLHFHTHTHEVLGIARGTVRAEFGGAKGKILDLKAGDVVILPAGTGYRRLKASRDLLIVGAYPANGGDYDEPRPADVSHSEALGSIARVRVPRADPVYGRDGPLKRLWRPVH
ncbi:MAG TPA: hypothetical protein VEU95_14470 [Micropepsaceae bacterium]|nr:hypothetical protein [Micropepsaceae bacterium]